jgi:hypothetical protein
MRNMVLGFVLGLLVGGSVWAGGGSQMFAPTLRSQPDRLWEQERGAALREYQQQLQQNMVHEQQLHELKREVETHKHKPC